MRHLIFALLGLLLAGCAGLTPTVTLPPPGPTPPPSPAMPPTETPAATATATSSPPTPSPLAMSSPTAKPSAGQAFPIGASLGQPAAASRIAFVDAQQILWVAELAAGHLIRIDSRASEPGWSPDGRWLHYRRGNEARRVPADRSQPPQPAPYGVWAPDGDRFAYEAEDGSLWVVDLTTGGEHQVAASPAPAGHFLGAPLWSPDGQRLVYSVQRNNPDGAPIYQGIWWVRADGSDAEELFAFSDPVADQALPVAWWPDGQELLFFHAYYFSASLQADGFPLFSLPLATRRPITLTQEAMLADEAYLSWAPDGSRLAFIEGGGRQTWTNKRLVLVDRLGRERRVLVEMTEQAPLHPAWSPDGTRIAYAAGPPRPPLAADVSDPQAALDARRIWVVNADGTGRHALTDSFSCGDEFPRWSHDGRLILFVRRCGTEVSLWVVPAEGGDARPVVTGLAVETAGGYYGRFCWPCLFDWWQPANPFDAVREALARRDVMAAYRHLLTGTEDLLAGADPHQSLADQPALLSRVQHALQRALPLSRADAGFREPLVRVAPADLDGDALQDLLVGLGLDDGIVLLIRQTDNGWHGSVASPSSPGLPLDLDAESPRVVAAGDLNGDGQPDLALAHRHSLNTEVLDLFTWAPDGPRSLFRASFSNWSGLTGFRLVPHGGVYDIEATCRQWGVFDHHLFPHQVRTITYRWIDGAYREVSNILEPPRTRRQQINVAEAALARWDLDAAVTAFRRVMEDPNLSDEREIYGEFGPPDWIAYARFRLGEIHALRGDVAAAREEMEQVAASAGPVAEAAQAFLAAYAGGDVLGAMDATYRNFGDPFGYYPAEHPHVDLRAYLEAHPEAVEQPLTEVLTGLPPVTVPGPCDPRMGGAPGGSRGPGVTPYPPPQETYLPPLSPTSARPATATLVPTPTGLLPPTPVTPPPPAWTPSPPPPWTGDDDRQRLAQTYIRLATDLLNATGGDPDAFLKQVHLWAPTPTPHPALTATPRRVMRTVAPGPFPTATPTATASPPPTPTPPAVSPTPTGVPLSTPAPSPTNPFPPSPTAALSPTSMPAPQRQPPASAWVHIADLDNDGAPEWLVSIPLVERRRYSGRDTQFFRCEVGMCPGLVVLFEQQRGLFTPVHLFEGGWLEHPRVLAVEDLNRDGRTELVLGSTSCGLSCFTRLLVGRWDGRRWHDLTADPIEQVNSQVALVDRDGDEVKEIVMYGGVGSTLGAGLQRKHTLVYAWQEGRYHLVENIPDPDPHIYFRMLDANAALAERDLDRALELAMGVITRPVVELQREAFVDEWAEVRIVSYAAIEAMLVHALRHEPGVMEGLLREIETKYDRLDNPYTEAGRRLWQTYQATQDPLAACEAVERTVQEQLDRARFFRYYSYNTERLPLQRVCPLDDSSQQVRERVDL